MKAEKNITENTYKPKLPRSYSIDEILAAGGPTAFANKSGKDPKRIIEKIALLPADSFLTDDEYNNAIATLKASK